MRNYFYYFTIAKVASNTVKQLKRKLNNVIQVCFISQNTFSVLQSPC